MTLIAFHAQPDRADVLADTLSYSRTARHLGHTSKTVLLPHLDAAVMTQGSTDFAKAWTAESLTAAEAADFDEFAARVGGTLGGLWGRLPGTGAGCERGRANSVVFAVGFSPRRGRFTAYSWASDFGFARAEIDGLHVQPSPLTVRPSALELHRLDRHFEANFGDVSPVDRLRRLPPPTAPVGDEGWVELALRVRADRALADLYGGFKTYVGGDVIHSRLTVGAAVQRRVHRFDDAGEEFNRMMAGSLHPAGQLAPCDCGSGLTFAVCCLDEIAADPCPCGSGDTFAGCCRVPQPAAA